jgi:hypothetical protein
VLLWEVPFGEPLERAPARYGRSLWPTIPTEDIKKMGFYIRARAGPPCSFTSTCADDTHCQLD